MEVIVSWGKRRGRSDLDGTGSVKDGVGEFNDIVWIGEVWSRMVNWGGNSGKGVGVVVKSN